MPFSNQINVQIPLERPVEGYPKLASHMGNYTSAQIFRRFSSLNSQNLPYLQAELIRLERTLRSLEAKDKLSESGRQHTFSVDWYWLNESRLEDGEQIKTAMAIRGSLRNTVTHLNHLQGWFC